MKHGKISLIYGGWCMGLATVATVAGLWGLALIAYAGGIIAIVSGWNRIPNEEKDP